MNTYRATVSTDAPYPIDTTHNVECTNDYTAASRAIKAHLDHLRKTHRLRKRGDTINIKLTKV